ncbi:MAG TPA: hypothetical protein VKO20_03870 [Desulfosalsimonadaceae bacterium]|nr:hypothetical protein [Desulfosalsimonadaceae bacterium]
MNEQSDNKDVFVRVKDNAGNEFLCPLEALKEIGEASDQELDQCVDDATVGRYASNIKVKNTD